jgi:glutathione S-transferase
MSLKIYAFPLSPRSFKPLWAANHLGIEFELVPVDLGTGEQTKAEFLAINPNARTPAIAHDGYALWESNAIVEYLASLKPDAGLVPVDTRDRLEVTKWLYWESAHWDPACAGFVFERYVKKLFRNADPDPVEIAKAEEQFARLGKVLDGVLAKTRYVAGDKLTVADLSLGASMTMVEKANFPVEPFRNVQRWGADLASLPSWKKTLALQTPPA